MKRLEAPRDEADQATRLHLIIGGGQQQRALLPREQHVPSAAPERQRLQLWMILGGENRA